jgi:hypothetical protein
MSPRNDTKHKILVFLRDYSNVIPSVIAIMNGLLAVYVAHYPFESPAAKLLFIVIIISLSAVAIGAMFYSQYLIVTGRAKERARVLMIREQLGAFIAEGTTLLNLAGTASVPVPTEQANAWATNVENFFATNMGASYVLRFRDSTGMPPGIFTIGVDELHQTLWRAIYSRMMKLEIFIKESPW